MQARAVLRFTGTSASKMRQVADLVRGKDVETALRSLDFATKAAAPPMAKLIRSAVSNAQEKANNAEEAFDPGLLFVETVHVDEGPTLKRFRPRAQGRAFRIRKRSCHVSLILGEREERVVVEPAPDASKKAAKTTPAKAKRSKTSKSKTKAKEKAGVA